MAKTTPSIISNIPIVDLHCDLLNYLARFPKATIFDTKSIGAALPHLKTGNVKHQILAIFTMTVSGSVELAQRQVEIYQNLLTTEHFYPIVNTKGLSKIHTDDAVGITLAIENASGLCEESESLPLAFQRLDKLLNTCERIAYIGLTHHTENRFGGGNYSDNIGLKPDGEHLLEYLNGKQIPIDLAHTSDNLAHDILNYIDAQALEIPIIASHSNFRALCDHVRNLPDELIQAIINRNGLMGMNFFRAYIHNSDSSFLIEHILKGFQDVPQQLAFGADFFYNQDYSHTVNLPLFFADYQDASVYPMILEQLKEKKVNRNLLNQLAYKNTDDFFGRIWAKKA